MRQFDKITEGATYKVEFTRGEEFAELGEQAPKEIMKLPHNFNMENEDMMNKFITAAKKVMKEKNYDTMVLQKETYEEFIFIAGRN